MATLLSVHKLSKSFPHGTLFREINFGIEEGDRIGLVGPNGAGKSTLLKILVGDEDADSGRISKKTGLRVGYLEQSPTFGEGKNVMETLLEGVEDPYDWESIARAQMWSSRLDFALNGIADEDLVGSLSGGWQKRVALARELMKEPHLLLLDEPTNHLDVESILWLEDFLSGQNDFAVFCITHDRSFLQRISTKIFDLDRKNPEGLLIANGTYSDYLEVKEGMLSSQAKLELKLKNTWRRENEWLRRGAKARTTKQQARIDRAYELEENLGELSDRIQNRSVDFSFKSIEGGPKKLIEVKKISKRFGDHVVFQNLNLFVSSKSRIGLLGPNGVGKSTLLKCLLGGLEPDSGETYRADHLKVSFFEQKKEGLDPNSTVLKTVCPQGEHVKFGGKFLHVHGYLEKFLFPKERIQTVVSKLSGGERSRLLLAQLMLEESNLIVLDEPTNDLDLETLHLLEEALGEFSGGLILVSHDRLFMDQLCTEVYSFHGGGLHRFADVLQWETWFREQPRRTEKVTKFAQSTVPAPRASTSSQGSAVKKLSLKDQKELQEIEFKIEKAENLVTQLSEQVNQDTGDRSKLKETSQKLAAAQAEVENLYSRWQELSQK